VPAAPELDDAACGGADVPARDTGEVAAIDAVAAAARPKNTAIRKPFICAPVL